MVPAVAEMRYLDRVKWLDLYGVDLHPVLVSEADVLRVAQAVENNGKRRVILKQNARPISNQSIYFAVHLKEEKKNAQRAI